MDARLGDMAGGLLRVDHLSRADHAMAQQADVASNCSVHFQSPGDTADIDLDSGPELQEVDSEGLLEWLAFDFRAHSQEQVELERLHTRIFHAVVPCFVEKQLHRRLAAVVTSLGMRNCDVQSDLQACHGDLQRVF